jgi:plasmid stabilization system protein ParE
MIYRVEVTDNADADADDIYEWIARDAPLAAVSWYEGLFDAIDSLSEFPQRCPFTPENVYFDEELRHLLYAQNYRIIFEIRGTVIYVLHIRHAARRYLHEEDLGR